jgi:predicted nuclease of restriction endonuclease-like (RecB) superfamily
MPVAKKRSASRRSAKAGRGAVSVLPKNYAAVLEAVKARIRAAQLRAALAVNSELVMLYWHIGREIMERQDKEGWGSKVVERLAKDLHKEFPDMGGFSRSNMLSMRRSQRRIRTHQLSNSLLDKFLGGTTCCSCHG